MSTSATTTTGALKCIVVTPEATALETSADFIALPLYDGEMGVAVNHSPMIGRLGYGELRIKQGDEQLRYYVDGGFVQVADNVVSVLTNRALPADEIDGQVAGERLREALARPALGEQELEIRERLIAQARGQMRVAEHAGS